MFVRWRCRKNDGGVTLDALLVESKRPKGGQPKLEHIAYLGTVPESGLERDAAIMWWADVARRIDKLPKRVDRAMVMRILDRKMFRPEPTMDERSVAYHEAGHAIANLAMGHKVEKVTIVPIAGESLGHCVPGRRRHRRIQWWVRDQAGGYRDRSDDEYIRHLERRHTQDSAVFAVAGVVGETFSRQGCPPTSVELLLEGGTGDASDAESVLKHIRGLYPSATMGRQLAVLQAIIARAAKLLHSHWGEVERLAEALLIYRTLTAAEVRKVLRKPRSA